RGEDLHAERGELLELARGEDRGVDVLRRVEDVARGRRRRRGDKQVEDVGRVGGDRQELPAGAAVADLAAADQAAGDDAVDCRRPGRGRGACAVEGGAGRQRAVV